MSVDSCHHLRLHSGLTSFSDRALSSSLIACKRLKPQDLQLLIQARWQEHLIEDIILGRTCHGMTSAGFQKLLMNHRLARARLELHIHAAITKDIHRHGTGEWMLSFHVPFSMETSSENITSPLEFDGPRLEEEGDLEAGSDSEMEDV